RTLLVTLRIVGAANPWRDDSECASASRPDRRDFLRRCDDAVQPRLLRQRGEADDLIEHRRAHSYLPQREIVDAREHCDGDDEWGLASDPRRLLVRRRVRRA